MARKTATKPELPPLSHLIALAQAGFTVHSYQNRSVVVTVEEGCPTTRSEWLPRLCLRFTDKGFSVIEWLPAGHPANAYGKDGFFPSSGHSNGGFSETIGQALGWFTWLAANSPK